MTQHKLDEIKTNLYDAMTKILEVEKTLTHIARELEDAKKESST
jgi:hypothetical protein